MRVTFARWAVAMGVGLAVAMTVEGCRKQAAPVPVQPVVRHVPRVQPDFPVGSLPVENIDPGVMPRADQGARRRQPVQPSEAGGADRQAADAQAAAERRQDARLYQQQQAASEAQQKELNQEIEQRTKAQQAVQAEPRIQDTIPGPAPAAVAPAQPVQPQ
jgi:hypothetical protein